MGVSLLLILRPSDTSPYNPSGVALRSGLEFMRVGIEKDILAQTLRTGGSLRVMIESMNGELYPVGGGVRW